ncbi:MAG TPA: hypothetical protein VMT02_03145 [Burkholderiales bacterium]|jgi:integral membrane sensor domain MASE1|nr:hypothetical protein [Burkholderiales bacterium]
MASRFGPVSLAANDARLRPFAAPAYWLLIPLVAIAYAAVAALSLALAIPPGYASAVWPPAGIALFAWLAFASATPAVTSTGRKASRPPSGRS